MTLLLFEHLIGKARMVKVKAGTAIKDALPEYDLENALIFINNEFRDPSYILKEEDIATVRLCPGAMTAFVITSIVLAVAAVVTGVVIGVQAYQAKLAAEKAAEELEKLKNSTNSDIDNRPFLRGASNTVATSAMQPYICGRHLFTPYLLCNPFYEISGTDGETQHTYTVLEAGFGKQVIDQVAIDDITILTLNDDEPQEGVYPLDAGQVFADGELEIAQDGELFSELDKLNYKVVSTTANEEVPRTADIESGDAEDYIFSLDAHARDVTLCISFTSGLYATNSDGDKISTSVTITPQYSLDGGSTWTSFTFYNSYTETYTNTFSRAISSKELRYTGTKEFSLSDYETLYNNGQKNILCRLRSSGANDSQICNTCYLLFYQSICFDPSTSSSPAGTLDDGGEAGLSKCLVLNDKERGLSTMIGLKVVATSSNESKLGKINIITNGLARTWDGEAWSDTKVKTRNPAAWALEILTSDTHPLSKFEDDEIDLESIGEFYEHCEENEYYFDYVISQKTKKETVLGFITDNCGAALYTDAAGRQAIAIDRVQENALAVYNPQNIISIENSREFARRTDCLRVTFINSENDLFEEDTYLVMRTVDGVPLELTADSVITDITTSGITSYEHVVKYARRMMAIESLRPKTTKIEVGQEGVFYTPYAKVLIQDDSLKIGTGSAVLEAVEWQSGIAKRLHLKNTVTIEEGKSYGVIINCFSDDGIVPLSVKVSGEVGTVSVLDILSDITSTIPQGGEVLSFGELDETGEFTKITTPYVIASISRSEDGFALELANYDEAIFDTGPIPDYMPNITQKPATTDADVPEDLIDRGALLDAIRSAIDSMASGSATNIGAPDTPTHVQATAEKDGISLSCTLGILGLRNDIASVTYEITKADESVIEVSSSSAAAFYTFDRATDGYIEAEELIQWKVRCKALNVYNGESDWSSSATVSTSSYGTWVVSAPSLSVAVSGRTITLTIMQPTLASGRERYGTFYNRIQIQKPSESSEWYKPATVLDPYASEDNWNEGEGYVTVEGTYTQTMPLTGQTLQDVEVEGEIVQQSSPEATLYRFRVVAYNEAAESEASEINATALGTGIQDIVQGSVTHDKISTPNLSAISANMGYITSGAFSGSELNYWALSTITGMSAQGIADVYEGAFRVGGEDEFLLVEPQVVNSRVTGYKMYFKAGVFEVTAEASTINGELIIQASEDALDRTRITPTGTYFEHRETSEHSDWSVISRINTSGIKSQLLTSEQSLVISNLSIAERRLLGHDIGRAYLSEDARVWHFDSDFLDQNQQEGLTITGDALLVDGESYPESALDFTPAILAVSPYAEDAKIAYGQFSAQISLAATNSCTVDFWLQYIWNENQELFDIGSNADAVRLVVANDECYYNDYTESRDDAPFNAEILESGDVVVWNEPAEASATIEHYGSGAATESVTLSSLGIAFAVNEWLHVGIVLSQSLLSVFLDTVRVDFNRFGSTALALDVSLNELAGTVILDELYIDTGAEEAFADFAANTAARIPWGTLDHESAHFILDADCLHTNIFDSEIFKQKVKEIVEEMINGNN